MEELIKQPLYSIVPVKEEVKQFVTEPQAYYGVTTSGFLFNIVSFDVLSNVSEKPDDFFCFMFIESDRGYYMLRQRFIMGFALPWVLEVKITPAEEDRMFFHNLRDYLRENRDKLPEICGEPIRQEMPDFSKIKTFGILQDDFYDII